MSYPIRYFCLLALSLYVAATTSATAGLYRCEIKHVYQLQNSGEMVRLPDDNPFVKAMKAKDFVVDRETGLITGALENHNSFGKPKVLDRGSNQQSFKVVTIYKPMTSVDLLIIQSYADAKEKPFQYTTAMGWIVTGVAVEDDA